MSTPVAAAPESIWDPSFLPGDEKPWAWVIPALLKITAREALQSPFNICIISG